MSETYMVYTGRNSYPIEQFLGSFGIACSMDSSGTIHVEQGGTEHPLKKGQAVYLDFAAPAPRVRIGDPPEEYPPGSQTIPAPRP